MIFLLSIYSTNDDEHITSSVKYGRQFILTTRPFVWTLQWRHNEWDGVSNHWRLVCLLNRWSRRRSNKTSMLRVTGLCAGISPVTGEFPAQRPVTQIEFPFDDVIMNAHYIFQVQLVLLQYTQDCNAPIFASREVTPLGRIIYTLFYGAIKVHARCFTRDILLP